MKENETYYQIKREEWSQYEGAHPFTMTREELAHLTSLNDRISLQDVQEVYVPMLDYFDLYFKKHIELRLDFPSSLRVRNERELPCHNFPGTPCDLRYRG